MDETAADYYDCSGKPDGDYAHPTDPTKFISCVAQTHAYERSCPPGMVFDEKLDVCVPPDQLTARE